jgi:hypothetical protein
MTRVQVVMSRRAELRTDHLHSRGGPVKAEDGGRAFYTALGHKGAYWPEPPSHVLGGIEMAAGVARFGCGEQDE